MVRTSRVERPEIDADNARRDNARVPAFDNSMGWLSYEPAGRRMAVGNGEHVPATGEVDWVGAPTACLPPASRQAVAAVAARGAQEGDPKAAATPGSSASQPSATPAANGNAAPQPDPVRLDQVRFEASPDIVKKLGILQPDHNMDAVIRHLLGLGIAFERSPVTLDLAALPPDLAKAIRNLPKGEPFVLPTRGKITVNVMIGH